MAKCVHDDDIGGCLKLLLFSRDKKRKEGCKEVEKGGQEEEDECKSSAIIMIMWTYTSWPPPSEFCPSSYSAQVSAASPWPCHDSTPRLLHERKEQKQQQKAASSVFFSSLSLSLSLLCLFCDALLECNTTKRKKTKGNKRYTSAPTKLPTKKTDPRKEKAKHLTSPKKQQQQHRFTKNLKKQKTNKPGPPPPHTQKLKN